MIVAAKMIVFMYPAPDYRRRPLCRLSQLLSLASQRRALYRHSGDRQPSNEVGMMDWVQKAAASLTLATRLTRRVPAGPADGSE